MKNFVIFVFCTIVVFLQLSVEGVFFLNSRIPNLTLALVITLVLTLGFKESLKWVLFAGFLIDAGSGAVFGTTTLVFFLVGWTISQLTDIADIRSKKSFFLIAFAVEVVFFEIAEDLFMLASLKVKENYLHESFSASLNFFSFDYIFKVAYTVFAAYVIYYLFWKVSRALFVKPIRLAKRNFNTLL